MSYLWGIACGVLGELQIFDVDDWHREIVSRDPRRYGENRREVIDGFKIIGVDQGQCMPAWYTINLVLPVVVYRSLEIHLTNYFVALENATAREV